MKIVFFVTLCLLATACSSRKVMKNCEPVQGDYWLCDKP